MIIPYIQGFAMGGSLIIAIGAQNAFVLSQGVKRTYPLIIPLICSICDAILIMAGIAGIGAFVSANPYLTQIAALGGAVFLFWYGFKAFCSALKGGTLEPNAKTQKSLRSAVFATLAVTLLNPHVYLDTIILLGSISSQYPENSRIFFGAGAMSASFIWFFSLSLGGKMLAPLFKQQTAWRLLDSLVCATMWAIALSLVTHQF